MYAAYNQEKLVLQVKNTGNISENVRCAVNETLKDAYVKENTGKIGLKNIATRLKLFYGKGAEVEILEEKGWVIVEIRIDRSVLSAVERMGV